MPTGYTADVGDGKVTDFRTFALRCARAFGATIMQRDDPMDEAPKHREPSDFYEKSLATERETLARLVRMSPAEAEAACEADYQQRLSSHFEYEEKSRVIRERYDAMLAEVKAWEPPTPAHFGMKDFMTKQLRESIDFDCGSYYDGEPKRENAIAWHEARISQSRERVARYASEAEQERSRVEEANAWIDALYDSLSSVTT